MNAFFGSGPLPRHFWLLSSLAFLSLTACATPRMAETASSNAETVDIGYGTVDKDHQVGSVNTVQGKDVQTDRSRTLGEMLARLPGVQVTESNGSLRVRIRGESNSFLGGEDPLFVVDGMVVSAGGIGGMNPNNIESISVLKNAGETAIYGSRGANGVILIKTKRD